MRSRRVGSITCGILMIFFGISSYWICRGHGHGGSVYELHREILKVDRERFSGMSF